EQVTTATTHQAGRYSTGREQELDTEAATSSKNLTPTSGEKLKAAVKVKNNERPMVQPGQHWRSCDLTGSLPAQWPRSPAICTQQLIRCCRGCGTSARTGRLTAKIDEATIKTKQRDNAVITRRS